MVISKHYAKKLVRQGMATEDGETRLSVNGPDDGSRFQIVIRHDIGRVDHYLLSDDDNAIIETICTHSTYRTLSHPGRNGENVPACYRY